MPGHEENDLLRMAAAAEERSNHPLAHAIVDYSRATLGLAWKPAEDVQILPGRGLTARVEEHDCLLGNEALFQEFFIPLPEGIAPPEPGVTRLWMALDNAPAGYFDARDALRPDAAEAVAALRQCRTARPDAHRRLRPPPRPSRSQAGHHRGRSRARSGRQAGPHSRAAAEPACA